MKSKSKLFLTFLPFALFSLLACPRQNNEDCQEEYQFTIPVSLSPVKDTFFLGDTIWMEINIPPTLLDVFSEMEKDLSVYPFMINASLTEYDDTGFHFAENKFSYFSLTGEIKVAGINATFLKINLLKDTDGSHKLKAGFLPEKKGIYKLEFYNISSDGSLLGFYEKNCLENFYFEYQMNNPLDSNNYHLLQNFPLNIVGSFDTHKFYGGYAFQVIE